MPTSCCCPSSSMAAQVAAMAGLWWSNGASSKELPFKLPSPAPYKAHVRRWSSYGTSRSSNVKSKGNGRHVMVMAAGTSTASQQQRADRAKYEQDAKVIQVHTVKQFEEALEAAKDKLVVVEYAASHSPHSRKIYPAMVELSLTCQDAVFILVMGDESGETKELCKRVGIEKVPHFVFYKSKEIIHEEEGIGPDELLGDVLYYGDPDAPIMQLHTREEMEALIGRNKEDGKLLVVDVGLKHCGPCVKVYPTFIKLSRKMNDSAVFARLNGDESDELMGLLKQLDVVEVPTFLFFSSGQLLGRYVGSGKGELIGEILRYQGVRVTY